MGVGLYLTTEISIHALLAESDRLCTILYSCPGNFYPRSPCGERLAKQLDRSPPLTFLSTLSLRRATVGASQGANIEHISIHALLAESDSYNLKIHQKQENFYPRSPCGERQSVGYSAVRLFIFLSTLSLRRATAQDILTALNNIFLSTLSLRRATDSNMNPQLEEGISIHALLAESDAPANVQHRKNQIFLSTLSLRRATSMAGRITSNGTFLSTLSLRRATRQTVILII